MGLVGQQVLVGLLEPMVLDHHLRYQMEHLPILPLLISFISSKVFREQPFVVLIP